VDGAADDHRPDTVRTKPLKSNAGTDPNAVPLFRCKSCFALYQVVKAQASPETVDLEIACRVSNGPLLARERQFVLKYFLLREASRLDVRRARQGSLRAKPAARRKKASVPI
jgi:hypothetical protein